MKKRTTLAALVMTIALPLSACSAVAADDTASTSSSTTSSSTTASTTGSQTTAMPEGGGGPGGPSSIDPSSVSSVSELDALIQDAYGDPGLGLHRGHQPVEATLIDVLGISHDEMHVRMDAGQNLAAVAEDLGIDPQTLIDALVEQYQPAIDTLESDGTISADEAAEYHDALVEAFTFRVTWNGSDATPTFSGIDA